MKEQRPLLFKLWLEKTKKMTHAHSILELSKILTENGITIDDFTYLQFTGLRDKNGVEIYEGDIFHLGDPNIKYIVEQHDCGLSGRQNGNKSRVGLTYWQSNIEVIGNVFEHP